MHHLGVKLVTSWVLKGYRVEAVASLVLRGQARDIEPGAFLDACRIYPQLTMKYEAIGQTTSRVKELRGTIEFVANNVMPAYLKDQLTDYRGDIQYEQLAVEFVTDSQTSDFDGDFLLPEPLLASLPSDLGSYLIKIPGGRKLAGWDKINWPGLKARGGREAYRRGFLPPLPHWSWFFDYAMPLPLTDTSKSFTGVYRLKNLTPGNQPDLTPSQNDGGTMRQKAFAWPPIQWLKDKSIQPYLLVRKLPRQGDFDNVHIMPDVKDMLGAPFCADNCLHLHVRWGTQAGRLAKNRYGFYGWGNGWHDQGGFRVVGAPLVPPNQLVKISVNQVISGEVTVKYHVEASKPAQGAPQVFFEQGLAYGFSYQNFPRWPLKGIEIGMNIDSAECGITAQICSSDVGFRNVFHALYAKMRYFDNDVDGIDLTGKKESKVSQVPGSVDAQGNLSFVVDPSLEGL